MGTSTRYLLRKRLGKHRFLLSGVAAVLLAIGTVAGFSYVRISREANKARAIHEYLEYVLSTIDPKNSGGRDVTAQLIDSANAALTARFASEPKIEADIRETIGKSLLSLGQFAAAEAQFERAVELRRRVLLPADQNTLSALTYLAEAYRERGRLDDAARCIREVLAANEASRGGDDRQTLRARITLAYLLVDMGRGADAERDMREARRRAVDRFGQTDRDALEAALTLALVLRDLGDADKLAEAERLCHETLRLRHDTLGPEHPSTIESLHRLATVLSVKGDQQAAAARYVEALELGEKVMSRPTPPDAPERIVHPDLLLWKSDLAYTLRALGRHDQAERIYERILPASLIARGERHPYHIVLRANLAAVLVEQKRWGEAQRQYEQVVELQQALKGPEDPDTLMFRDALASALSAQNKWDEAVRIYRATFETRKGLLRSDDPQLLASARNLATAMSYHASHHQAAAAGRAETRPVE